MRLTVLDGFRGFFLLFMAVAHINMVTDTILGRLNHHSFGWVEDAQGFVFISGFVVGLVYGSILLKRSVDKMRHAMFYRVRTIYAHQVVLIMFMVIAAFFYLQFGAETPSALRPYADDPLIFTASSLLLVANSLHMGILPMYIAFMLVTPFVLIALQRGYLAPLAMGSVLLWLIAQTGLVEEMTNQLEFWMAGHGVPAKLGIYFHVFGWQLIFFAGLVLGYKMADGSLDLSKLNAPAYTYAFMVGLAGAIFLGIFDRIVYDEWISPEYSASVLSGVERKNFSAIYMVNFFLDLFLLAWLVNAGPNCGIRWIERAAALVTWVFSRRALVFLGQHSLHVFSFHILLVYVIDILSEGHRYSELSGNVVMILGAASLYLPAWLHARLQAREKARSPNGRTA